MLHVRADDRAEARDSASRRASARRDPRRSSSCPTSTTPLGETKCVSCSPSSCASAFISRTNCHLLAAGGDRERERVVVPRVEEQRVEELPGLDLLAGAQALAHERHARHRLVDLTMSCGRSFRSASSAVMIFVVDATWRRSCACYCPEHAARLRVDEDRRRAEEPRRERVRDERAAGEQPLRRDLRARRPSARRRRCGDARRRDATRPASDDWLREPTHAPPAPASTTAHADGREAAQAVPVALLRRRGTYVAGTIRSGATARSIRAAPDVLNRAHVGRTGLQWPPCARPPRSARASSPSSRRRATCAARRRRSSRAPTTARRC